MLGLSCRVRPEQEVADIVRQGGVREEAQELQLVALVQKVPKSFLSGKSSIGFDKIIFLV